MLPTIKLHSVRLMLFSQYILWNGELSIRQIYPWNNKRDSIVVKIYTIAMQLMSCYASTSTMQRQQERIACMLDVVRKHTFSFAIIERKWKRERDRWSEGRAAAKEGGGRGGERSMAKFIESNNLPNCICTTAMTNNDGISNEHTYTHTRV